LVTVNLYAYACMTVIVAYRRCLVGIDLKSMRNGLCPVVVTLVQLAAV
jgi:hypothetical protein